MTNLLPAEEIERIVGMPRHPERHYGRAVSAEQTVYIMHSQQCFDTITDLRECPFSIALDVGIDMASWDGHEDEAVMLQIKDGNLEPCNVHT